MDILTFLASVIASLAWPATVIAALFILRRPLERVIPTLRRLKYKDIDVEFGVETEVKDQLVKEAAKELQKAAQPEQQALQQASRSADEEWSFSRTVLDALVKDNGPFAGASLRSEAKLSVGDTVMYADAIVEAPWVSYVIEVKLPKDKQAIQRAVRTAVRNAEAYSMYLGRVKGVRHAVQPVVVVPADSFVENALHHVPVLRYDAGRKEFVNLDQVHLNNLMGAFVSEPL